MRGQRGWRELSVLGDKLNKFTGMIEGFIWSPRGSDSNDQVDDWAFEEVVSYTIGIKLLLYLATPDSLLQGQLESASNSIKVMGTVKNYYYFFL